MRELKGVNEVHKSNTDYNSRVLRAMKFAQSTKTPDEFANCLSGAKTLENVSDRIEWEMPEELKNRQLDNTDPKPLVVAEIENGFKEEEEEER